MSVPPCPKLLHAVAERVAPLFFGVASTSRDTARLAAIKAIEAYEPRTPSDYATVARILSLSLAAMSAVNRAMEPELSVDLQLGYYNKATAFSQAALRSEAALTRSREAAAGEAEVSTAAEPTVQEVAAILLAVDKAMVEFEKLQFPVDDPTDGCAGLAISLTPAPSSLGQRLC